MRFFQSSKLLLLIAVIGASADSVFAQQYPRTQFQGFETTGFGLHDHQSMSPDSWGSAAQPIRINRRDTNDFVPRNSRAVAKDDSSQRFPTPNIPDLKSEIQISEPLSNRLHPSNDPVEPGNFGTPLSKRPPSKRYPLTSNSQGARAAINRDQQTQQRFGIASVQQRRANRAASQQGSGQRGSSQSSLIGGRPNVNSGGRRGYRPFAHGDGSGSRQTGSSHDFSGDVDGFQQEPADPGFYPKEYRPDLGQRSPYPIQRHAGSYDTGQVYDFEDKKKQYPKIGEILVTGRYFASTAALFLRPAFQDNTAIETSGGSFNQSIPFDYDNEGAPFFRFGFESKFGPGVEIEYWQFDEGSNPASLIHDGFGTASIDVGPSSLSTTIAGDVLAVQSSIDVESIGVSFFKEIKFPISRLNGMFGIHYASIEQELEAAINGPGGAQSARARSNFQAYGPRIALEYYRPVGHTKLEFLTSFASSVLFGRRDQFVESSADGSFSRVGADEFLTTINFFSGIQFKKSIAENRGYFVRAGAIYQSWIGGGTAADPNGDFALRGFSFAVGYNR